MGAVQVVPVPGRTGFHASILVVRVEAGLRAYWNTCTHLPVPLDSGTGALPAGEDLVCITHGARYAKADGRCVAGPGRGGLEPVELVQDGARWFAVLD